MKWMHFIFICHLLPLIIYWCWLFFMCKMFLLFFTDVYLIFCYWNISMKWADFIFICYLLMLICCITAFDNLMMLTIFHVQNVLIILDWCLCDFLVLKHINEVDALHLLILHVDHVALLPLIIYWCWLFFMCKIFLLFLTDVYVIFCFWNISMKWMHFIFICYLHDFLCGKYVCNFKTAFDNLMMLTIFHVQNVLIILDWCLCDFLVPKHIDKVDALHLHLSLIYFLCRKYSTISILLLIIYWCWLFFICKMFLSFSTECLCDFLCTETYW